MEISDRFCSSFFSHRTAMAHRLVDSEVRFDRVQLLFALEEHLPTADENRPLYAWAIIAMRGAFVHYVTELVAQYADLYRRYCISANPFVTAKYVGTGASLHAGQAVFASTLLLELPGIGVVLLNKRRGTATTDDAEPSEDQHYASATLLQYPRTVAASACGQWTIFPHECGTVDYSLSAPIPASAVQPPQAPYVIMPSAIGFVCDGKETSVALDSPVQVPGVFFLRRIELGKVPWNAVPQDLSKLTAVSLTIQTPVLTCHRACLGSTIRREVPAVHRVSDGRFWADMGSFKGPLLDAVWQPKLYTRPPKGCQAFTQFALPDCDQHSRWLPRDKPPAKRRRVI